MTSGHRERSVIWISLTLLSLILMVSPSVLGVEREKEIYKDGKDDVLADSKKGPLDRLMDLEKLDGEKADEFVERPNVDISSLTIIEGDTYVSYLITVQQKVQSNANYTYYICGYTRNDPEKAETFDFIIRYSGGETSYSTWKEGKYIEGNNVSKVRLDGPSINLTMHRNNFILGTRSVPYLICGIVVLQTGEGKDRYIDYVLTDGSSNESSGFIDDSTMIILQMAFIGILVLVMLVLWNFWSRKKESEQEGGVCPKCEARLDKNLDFCPHCGSFIRGPEADKETPRPRIVSPLDQELEE